MNVPNALTGLAQQAARCLLLLLGVTLSGALSAGAVMDGIRARDELRCGVSEGITGFSEQVQGHWFGLEVDFCRAVAAAILGDAEKVEFLPLKASTRFPALQARRIDLLARNTSWTLTREALLRVQFPAVLFYDGQAFMVARSSGVARFADLRDATVCVEKGTTHEQNLADLSREQGLNLRPLVIDSAQVAAQALFDGRCGAFSSDSAQLAAARLRAPGGAQDFVILAERISKEPLGPVVAQGDEQWASVVRWVFFSLLLAEEHDLTQANVDMRLQGLDGPLGQLLRGQDARLAQALGVRPDWVLLAVRAGGNYGELFARNLGQRSPLNLERGLNRLWRDGGLMYAPPID